MKLLIFFSLLNAITLNLTSAQINEDTKIAHMSTEEKIRELETTNAFLLKLLEDASIEVGAVRYNAAERDARNQEIIQRLEQLNFAFHLQGLMLWQQISEQQLPPSPRSPTVPPLLRQNDPARANNQYNNSLNGQMQRNSSSPSNHYISWQSGSCGH